ncbi:MAG: elongation factor Ts [Patescibacteria group bacterium]
MANIDLLKQLREETGISVSECKKALEEAAGDIKRAKEILRERGKEIMKGKATRAVSKGLIEVYLHPGSKVGVLLELSCESDFVAKGEDFKKLAHEICLQIAATKPMFIRAEDIPQETIDEEKKIYQKQAQALGKPANFTEQIVSGKLKKYKDEVSLLSQPWVKDVSKTIQDLIADYVARLGERVEVKRFTRYEI